MAASSRSTITAAHPRIVQPGDLVEGTLHEIQVLDVESLLARIHDVELILPAELEIKLRPLVGKDISLLHLGDRISIKEVRF